MAPAPTHFYQGFIELPFLWSVIALWCALLGSGSTMKGTPPPSTSGSTVKVTQGPPFASFLQEMNLTFSCSHSDSSSYNFFWYRQLPGEKELQQIGAFYFHSDMLTEELKKHNPKDWLRGEWLEKGKKMKLVLQGLQPSDTGLYLCSARATVREAGTGAGAKVSASNKYPQLLLCAAEKAKALTPHNQWASWRHTLQLGYTSKLSTSNLTHTKPALCRACHH
ncbi:uncharacterized protein LOC133378236 [Rhineura floridana]|uniref:uncharacterized protein LOC133378236 n=1 Tax=Rhineura floridana TaxID=261503 RepID=UPI002AC802B0|nr:uncharacterized protein LOC133378236 [Rhineura floridana]